MQHVIQAPLSAKPGSTAQQTNSPSQPTRSASASQVDVACERGGPAGLEPTRYGDWERNGRCIDF
jgi:shikimate dehydrogenase